MKDFMSVVPVQTRKRAVADQLDGILCSDGELVLVKWPTGEITAETLQVDSVPAMVNNHLGWDHRSYVNSEVNGTKVRVYFRWKKDGTKLQRVALDKR